MDLLSLVVQLKPLPAGQNSNALPAWWGRAAHAALLNIVRQYQPRLADSLHTGPAPSANPQACDNPSFTLRPFTVSSLMGRFTHGELDLSQVYTLRLTSLLPELSALLQQASQEGPLIAGRQLELDYLPFEIVAVHSAPSPQAPHVWSASNSYQELSAPYLLARVNPERRVSLRLASPTTFKTAGRHMPFPLPELVFGSLLERWNAFAPITLPAEVRRYAAECLAVSCYHLRTLSVPFKSGGLRVGSVGEVSYTSLNYDRYWMSLIHLLAEFSLYSGVGAGTTQGLGQVRRLDSPQTAAM